MDAVTLSEELIRCPSVTPAEGGALDLLQARLETLGFTCHRLVFSDENTPDVDNLYARLGACGPNFCFAGHTDVVPPGDPGRWTSDPFKPEVRGGKLYGRGASDMKCAIAAMVAGTSAFIGGNADFGGSISFLITGDEEGPGVNGTRKVLNWMRENGERIDACLVGEPTNPLELGEMAKIGRRGSLNCWLTVKGVQGHSAYPHLADNPVHRLMKMLGNMLAPLDEGTEHFPATTVAVTTADVANPAANVIPAEATGRFNIRFNDLHTGESLKQLIKERCDAAYGDGETPDYDITVRVSGEAFLTPPGPLSDVVAGAVKHITGRDPALGTTGGTSDARFIKDVCPVIEFGMMNETAHKVDEFSPVEDIRRLADIYKETLSRYFS